MKNRICLLIAVALAVCGLVLTLGILIWPSSVVVPVSAQNLQQEETHCAFQSIAVTAASLGVTPGVSDTLPGSPYSRTLYFANLQPGVITVSVTIPESCHAWGGAAFSQTERSLFQPEASSQRWLTYPVGTGHGSTTMVLTSSLYITGSMQFTISHQVVLSFERDITPPLVSSPVITEYSKYLYTVGTQLYYTNTIPVGEKHRFWVGGSASDVPSGLARATFLPAFEDAPLPDMTPTAWKAEYDVSRDNSDDGVITVTLYDRVGLATPQIFPYELDGTPPTSTITSQPPSPRSESVQLNWEANDTQSGVQMVELWYKKEATGVWQTTGITSTGTTGLFDAFDFSDGDGTYFFATVATDNLGNKEAMPASAEIQVLYDASVPASRITTAPQYARISPITVTWEATATVSGLAETRLWYCFNEGDWISTTLTSTVSSGEFSFTPDDYKGEGRYDLATHAISKAGKEEQSPEGEGDVTVYYDHTIMPPWGFLVQPADWANTNAFTATWSVSPTEVSGIAGAWYKLESAPTSTTDGLSVTDVVTTLSGITVTAEGGHSLWVWLYDHAGNISHTMVVSGLLKYDGTSPTGVTITAPTHISATTFTVSWLAKDATSGVAFYTVAYSNTISADWQDWLTKTTAVSGIFTASQTDVDYTFRVTAYDRAGNYASSQKITRVGPFRIYLPLTLRNYAPFSNGGFENGWGPWVHGSGPFGVSGTGLDQGIVSFEGSNRARLGNPAYQDGHIPVGYAYIAQEFSVPMSNPYLSLQYRVHSRDTVWGLSTHRYFDTFEFSINRPPEQISDGERDSQGCHDPLKLNPTGTLTPPGDGLVFCGGQPPLKPPHEWDSGWRTVTLDLSAFAGRNVTLYIVTWNREYNSPWINDQGYYNTYSYVDNIVVEGD